MLRVTLIVHGHVQAVNFRNETTQRAQELTLVGSVQNLSDTTVRVIAEGQKVALQSLLDFCYNGVSGAHVEHIDVEWTKATGEFDLFKVRI